MPFYPNVLWLQLLIRTDLPSVSYLDVLCLHEKMQTASECTYMMSICTCIIMLERFLRRSHFTWWTLPLSLDGRIKEICLKQARVGNNQAYKNITYNFKYWKCIQNYTRKMKIKVMYDILLIILFKQPPVLKHKLIR